MRRIALPGCGKKGTDSLFRRTRQRRFDQLFWRKWRLSPFFRNLLVVVLGVSAVSQIPAQRGLADPEFAKVPFDQWLVGAGQAQIKWSARILPAALSSFQRLLAGVEVSVDGAELARRRGEGQLLIFVQLNDEAGAAWQDHGAIDLEKVEEGLKASNVVYTETAFVLPGDYRVSIAIFDTATGEHSVRKDKLHVAPLKNDPLPQSWRDLPAVEFRPPVEPPDSWFLPAVTGRLHLPLEAKRPIHIDVLVNLTPSERMSGSLRARDRNLSAMLPALKSIVQIDSTHASVDIALLDLSRRRVIFHQEQARELDWAATKTSLEEADPGTIDVKSLADRRHNAAFFVTEVARRINPAQSTLARVVIVLSSPVAFEPGEDLRPIQIAPAPDCRIFYFRFHAARPRRAYAPPTSSGRRHRPEATIPMEARRPEAPDQLAGTLRPLAPRLFDVERPDDFRKALAAMLAEIAQM